MGRWVPNNNFGEGGEPRIAGDVGRIGGHQTRLTVSSGIESGLLAAPGLQVGKQRRAPLARYQPEMKRKGVYAIKGGAEGR